MIVQVPQLLSQEQLVLIRNKLETTPDAWVHGKVTAGHQGIQVKNNQQVDESSVLAHELGDLILSALERNALFISATLPNLVYPPMFNRYSEGMHFGNHVDGAVRMVPGSGRKIRTDISATLFLASPDEYTGGELVIEDTYGTHAIKLAAGDMIVYPASSVHRVMPVTQGVRLASFFWVQSLVPEDANRALLFELDSAIQQLNMTAADEVARVKLTGCYHNLLRKWTQV